VSGISAVRSAFLRVAILVARGDSQVFGDVVPTDISSLVRVCPAAQANWPIPA
jgi:hypothetical protein